MNKLKNILVCADFSPGAKAALKQAARLAKHGTKVHVLHGLDPLEVAEAAVILGQPAHEFERLTSEGARARLVELAAKAGLSRARIEVRTGPIIETILQASLALPADLVMLGLHGQEHDARGAGALATRCLRKMNSKVLLVQPATMRSFRRILACVDFSETSREVIRQACIVAQADSAKVECLHIFHAPWRRLGFRSESAQDLLEKTNEHQRRLLEHLQEFASECAAAPVRCCVAEAENAGRGIAEYARQNKVDLVVLGRRGRTPLGYILMGSTVERLARELDCSLLAVAKTPPRVPAEAIAWTPENLNQ